MKKTFSLALFLIALLAVVMLCGAAQNGKPLAESQETPLQCAAETEAKPEYTNLRATRYKNLYLTKYPSLAETLIRDQIKEQEEAMANAGTGTGTGTGTNTGTGTGTSSGSTAGNGPDTGDHSNLTMWLGLTLLALAIAALLFGFALKKAKPAKH